MFRKTKPVTAAHIMIGMNSATMLASGFRVSRFQCGPGDNGKFSLNGKKHNYVGHATVLR